MMNPGYHRYTKLPSASQHGEIPVLGLGLEPEPEPVLGLSSELGPVLGLGLGLELHRQPVQVMPPAPVLIIQITTFSQSLFPS